MNWLNLNIQTLDSPEVLGASPVERATWLFLLRYCIGQENGGRIAACRLWKDRQWQQVIRVTQREVLTETDLWAWDGDDLVVMYYPSGKEAEVKTKRKAALENGKKGGRPAKITNTGTNDETQEKPTLVIFANQSPKPEGERKEKEKGKESVQETTREPIPPLCGNESPSGGSGSVSIPPVELEQAKRAAPQCGVSVEAAETWWLDHDARGWTDTKGQPVRNWRSSLTAYGRRWQANDHQHGTNGRRTADANHRPNRNSEFGF